MLITTPTARQIYGSIHHKKKNLYLNYIYKHYLTKIFLKPSYTDIMRRPFVVTHTIPKRLSHEIEMGYNCWNKAVGKMPLVVIKYILRYCLDLNSNSNICNGGVWGGKIVISVPGNFFLPRGFSMLLKSLSRILPQSIYANIPRPIYKTNNNNYYMITNNNS